MVARHGKSVHVLRFLQSLLMEIVANVSSHEILQPMENKMVNTKKTAKRLELSVCLFWVLSDSNNHSRDRKTNVNNFLFPSVYTPAKQSPVPFCQEITLCSHRPWLTVFLLNLSVYQSLHTDGNLHSYLSSIWHNHIPFIGQVRFVPNKHDNDITSSLRSDIIDPLWSLLEWI